MAALTADRTAAQRSEAWSIPLDTANWSSGTAFGRLLDPEV